MALNLIPVQPSLIVRSSLTSGNQNSSDQQSQRKSWWSPLFGWSSEPDYIDSTNTVRSGSISEPDPDQKTVRSRVSPTNFTDEKARKLRMLTMETETFHDAMYHSAIASRLASDFSDRSDR
ncbi:hypothetical protein QVD17_27663 [Tagetes erecta]|uniref:Uncharacterized protein n=1 Tax=Tagetes erecta TaxID=13708 RepID=A0AAD8NRT8_TARER|nr:hypothetical protein QVD17_27663 [Tagetes erecta]